MENTGKQNKLVHATSTTKENQIQNRSTQWGRKTRLVRKTKIWQPKENHAMAIA
jgi:hypothetical protein